MLTKLFNRWKKKDPVIERNHAYFKEFNQERPLASYEFVVFDSELTGLNPKRDEIVSMGAVRIRDFRIVVSETYHQFVKPAKPLPKDSTLIHRITPEQIESAPKIEQVLKDFIEFCDGALIVGHYIDLDMAFINKVCSKQLGAPLGNPCIDTLRLAQVYREEKWGNYYDQFDYKVSFNLADLTKEYGLPEFPQHDALQDALQTAYLFLFLTKKLKQGGITTLKDLYLAGRSWRWLF